MGRYERKATEGRETEPLADRMPTIPDEELRPLDWTWVLSGFSTTWLIHSSRMVARSGRFRTKPSVSATPSVASGAAARHDLRMRFVVA